MVVVVLQTIPPPGKVWYHIINRVFREHTPTHSWQKADQIEIGRVSLASNRRTGAEKNATNGHTGNDKATTTRIAAINVDVMMTATVLTVGARRRCPRTQEHRRGSGVAPDPDKWLTMRTVSAGGGHGPILLGKSEAGGGSIASTQRPTNSYVNLQGDFLH